VPARGLRRSDAWVTAAGIVTVPGEKLLLVDRLVRLHDGTARDAAATGAA
jgi:hypothetical protein